MELWVPWIKIALIALVAFGLMYIRYRLTLTNDRKRSILRLAFGAGSISLFLFVAYLTFAQSGPRNSKLVGSPDGAHVARIMITSGTVVDSRFSSVIVRKSGSPAWQRAYYGFGYFQEGGPAEPYIHWADNSHLIIDYQQSKIEPSICVNKVEDVAVECRVHNW